MMTRAQVTCDKCNGSGETVRPKDRCVDCEGRKVLEEKKIHKIEIEKGMKEDEKIVLHGESDEAPGAQAGDLVFVIKEKKHEVFERRGNHLFMEKTIPLVSALCGFEFIVKHLDDRQILVKSPSGSVITPNETKEIVNEGMPVHTRPYEHGSLYIKFHIEFPQRLSTDVISRLASALPGALPPVTGDRASMNEAVLVEVNPHRLQDDGTSRNAYDESDEDEGHGHGGVQCAQQ
jgi:DnaJ family protein A protein 2